MTYYFDYAAATPVLPEVLTAMQPYFSEQFYNPSAIYMAARAVKKDLQVARATVARQIGAKPSEIVFTAGGTEANNLAITGVASQYDNPHVVVSQIEHESVLMPAKKHTTSFITVNSAGRIDIHSLPKIITDETVLVSVILANNEIGTIQDLRAVTTLAAEITKDRLKRGILRPLLVHTDACQAVNYVDIHVARLGIDLMTINSGKIYGPKQAGALFVKTGTQLAPLILGGGQEHNLRSGTENVASYIGLAAAISIATSARAEEVQRLAALQTRLIDELVDGKTIRLNGEPKKWRLVNNVHLTLAGTDNERILMELDERGIQVATGSACAASSGEPSHVLSAIGLSDNDARSSIRISLGRHSTASQCAQLIHAIKEVVAKS